MPHSSLPNTMAGQPSVVPLFHHRPVPSSAHAMTLSVANRGRHQAIQRLEVLEHRIRYYRGDVLHPDWINEYIDLGLDLADNAQQQHLCALQESWLKRIYLTLRDTAFCPDCSEGWRQQCLEFLYQPFFALQHVYRAQSDGRSKIRRLFKDLSLLTRYVM